MGVVPEKNQNLGASATLAESIRGFGEKGFTFSKSEFLPQGFLHTIDCNAVIELPRP